MAGDTATTSTFGKERLLALDALRGAAALIVAIGHGQLIHGEDFTLCVLFFFILSGYVLAYAYGDAIASGKMGTYEFLVVRFARLYPLHILTAAIVGAMWTSAVLFRGHHPPDFTILGVIETVTLTQSLFSGGWSLNLPSWSIGAEFWCGLLMLPLLWPSRWGHATAILLGAVLFVTADLYGGFIASTTGRYGIAAGCFVIGWALHSVRAKRLAWLGWPIAVCAFAAVMFPLIPADGHPLIELIYVAAFAAVVFFLSRADMPKGTRWLAALFGDLSYGIYLWHWPLQRVMPLSTPAQCLLFFVCLIAISWLSFKFFELPMKRNIRAFALRRNMRVQPVTLS
jgi:peptidoglycan/LPS O-acetylase OafA/YrhL